MPRFLRLGASPRRRFGNATAADEVWHVYHDSEANHYASLAVVDEAEIQEGEAHWPFSMQCSVRNPWTMVVASVDTKVLGAALAGNQMVDFSFVVDREVGGHELGGYNPSLHFNMMMGTWGLLGRLGPRHGP